MRMMRLAVTLALLGGLLVGPGAGAAAAETVTELDEQPERFHGRTVQVFGELVGDFGRRDGHVWTQLNDDAYGTAPLREGGSLAGGNTGIALAMPEEVFDEVLGRQAAPGGYRTRGPLVEVTAVFHYHDPERSGETWLEATSLKLIEEDRPLSEPHRFAYGLTGAVLGMLGVFLHFRNRRRL